MIFDDSMKHAQWNNETRLSNTLQFCKISSVAEVKHFQKDIIAQTNEKYNVLYALTGI